ncbi:MAG: protein kinase [Vicinamibacteria bacterium]|nr:protein kinase [Vicinamibacteria bacterium]
MKRPTLGLLGRTVLALSATALAPLAVAPYLVALNREAIGDQVLRTHAVAARSTAARVQAFLETLSGPARALALNPAVLADPRGVAAREMLAGLLQAQPLILGAAIVNADGAEVVRAQSRGGAEIVTAVLADPSPGPIVVAEASGATWLRLALPLDAGLGQLLVVADPSPLEAVLATEELGREAQLAVVSRTSGVLLASEVGLTLRSFPRTLVDAGRVGHTSGASRFEGDDGGALGAYAPVAGAPFFVLSSQPVAVAEEVAVQMRERSLWAVGGALALAGAFSVIAWRTVIRPVRRLAVAQARLAGAAVRGKDEIEQLAASFRTLERVVQDRDSLGEVFLGRYLVLERLGSGGMGTVFKGWDPRLERPVALKTIHLGGEFDKVVRGEQRSTLLREAVTAAQFSHPNIVAVYDVEDVGDAAFIAMELVEGRSFESWLHRTPRPTPAEVAVIGLGVARGLAAAHQRGVLHRDIKPANVLLAKDGAIKVTDFGIAGHISERARDAGLVFGTPGYLPPEALRGEGQDGSSDLFALGVVLYEGLTGWSPFAAPTPVESFDRTLTRDPEPPHERNPDVPEDLSKLVLGLLAKARDERLPRDAAALAEQFAAMVTRHGFRFTGLPAELEPPEAWQGRETQAGLHHTLVRPRTTIKPAGAPRG